MIFVPWIISCPRLPKGLRISSVGYRVAVIMGSAPTSLLATHEHAKQVPTAGAVYVLISPPRMPFPHIYIISSFRFRLRNPILGEPSRATIAEDPP